MQPVFRNIALALATAAVLTPAHAGLLTFQDVVFTTTWTGNVLTLEIDAGQHSGDWTRATSIGALSFKDIGSFQSVKVTSAPQGAEAWMMRAGELTAKGCIGAGGRNRDRTSLCLTGTPAALSDNMVFTFAFTGTPSLEQPHLKVNFFDGSNNKVGDLLSQTIKSAPVVVATPVTPPVTQPVTPPVTSPITPPVTLPSSGQTAGNETPPADTPIATTPIPLPPPGPATQPVLVLEPVSATAGATEVPEPRTIALLLAGLALMALTLCRRN